MGKINVYDKIIMKKNKNVEEDFGMEFTAC